MSFLLYPLARRSFSLPKPCFPLQYFKSIAIKRNFATSCLESVLDMETVDTSARLKALRSLMKSHGVDVYIVPSEDSHQSEYIAPCDARRGLFRRFPFRCLCSFLNIVIRISLKRKAT